MKPYRRVIITIAAGICAGLGLSYVWNTPTDGQREEEEQVQVRLTPPEKRLKTSEFSVNLLKTAVQVQTEGNVMVAPDSLVALLARLQEFATGPAKAALDALHLPDGLIQTAVLPSEVALIFPDAAVKINPSIPTGRDIYPVPFSSDLPSAYIGIEKALSFYSEQELNGTALSSLIPPASGAGRSGKAGNPGLRMVVIHGISFHEPWMQPPNPKKTYTADFINADGSSRLVSMVKHQGHYRVAKADDGSWEAVAIFFRNSQKGDSACFVAILPKDYRVRDFVQRELTPDKLNEIRTALLQASPTACTIEIPAMEGRSFTQDISPILKAMGLESLFQDSRPFLKLTDQADTPLTMVIQQNRLELKETQGLQEGEEPTPAWGDYPTAVKFDRPFLWYIGDLTSDLPPYLMGIREKAED